MKSKRELKEEAEGDKDGQEDQGTETDSKRSEPAP